MTSATAALQSLDAHRRVVENEKQQMKDDVAFLRDLRRRYTLPLSELPPCKGLPAPVAASARKFLVETEAYIMRRISASQSQAAEISTQADHLRDTINQTASMAHAIAGTQPTPYANAPGGMMGYGGGGGNNNAAAAIAAANAAAVGGTMPYNPAMMHGGGAGGAIQTPPTIGFSDPLFSPGGASRFSGVPRNGGGGGVAGISPMPSMPGAFGGGAGFAGPMGGAVGPEIRFEAPMGVLPYMTAASAAYRQQQALAYLAADQGVLPRGWQPAPMQGGAQFGPASAAGGVGGGAGGGGAVGFRAGSSSGMNISPSRMRANEMSGANGGDTTFVVLPRAGSAEPRRGGRKPSFRPVR